MAIKMVRPFPGMVITENVRLEPGEYDFRDGQGIAIGADGVTVDAQGVTLRGGCQPVAASNESTTEAFGYDGQADPNNAASLGFFGIGLLIEGRRDVTVRGLAMSGFDQGAKLLSSQRVSLLECDFSDCFSDPAWGWDEHGFHGAILMIGTHHSTIADCRANRVWDALNMRHSDHNTVTRNNFSHTSDTGLKLWHACDNTIVENDFSYGIRIDPGEVHARDSSSVLIESGSNRNTFVRNDMTHGGDGLFLRVLNGWVSAYNVFEENDCSYANNNAIEAWADHNTYIRNKANYSSYGFWLGNSDHTVLIGNEAAFNGGINHNAPESFGNAGIAIVNGSGSHCVMRDNDIHDNSGPGVAIRHELARPSSHWIIEGNRVYRNRDCGKYRGHGIFLNHAQWVTIGRNAFEDNDGEPVHCADNVTDIVALAGDGESVGAVRIVCPAAPRLAGQPIELRAQFADGLRCRWDFGDGCTAMGAAVSHTYAEPGLYVVGVTADNGAHASLDGYNLYVLPADFLPLGQECAAASENVEVTAIAGMYGQGAVRATAGGGKQHALTLTRNSPLAPEGRNALLMQLCYHSDADTDWKRETRYPVIELIGDRQNKLTLTPTQPLLEMLYAQRNEEREHGRLFLVPFSGGEYFTAAVDGSGIEGGIAAVKLTYGGMSDAYSELIVNAIGVGTMQPPEAKRVDLTAGISEILADGAEDGVDFHAPLRSTGRMSGDATPRVCFAGAGAYGVRLDTARTIDHVSVTFYQNATHTQAARGERLPASFCVEVMEDGGWRTVAEGCVAHQNRPTECRFAPTVADGVRVRFAAQGAPVAVCGFHAYHDRAVQGVRWSIEPRQVAIDRIEVKLNIERNGNGSPLGDLVARVHAVEDGKLTDRLFEAVIAKEQVVPYAITCIPTQGLMLREGQRYALALGQTEEAASRTEGDYYRWIAGQIPSDETFAIWSDGETLPADYDWGTAWLRVASGQTAAEYLHDSQHVGTRFGIKGMQCRYQTFIAPQRVVLLTDGKASGDGRALKLEAGEVLCAALPEETPVSAAHVYLQGRLPSCLSLTDDQGREACRLDVPRTGLNVLPTGGVVARAWRLSAPQASEMCEVELI